MHENEVKVVVVANLQVLIPISVGDVSRKVGTAFITAPSLQSTQISVSVPTKEYPSAQPDKVAVEAAAPAKRTKLSVKVDGAVHLVLS